MSDMPKTLWIGWRNESGAFVPDIADTTHYAYALIPEGIEPDDAAVVSQNVAVDLASLQCDLAKSTHKLREVCEAVINAKIAEDDCRSQEAWECLCDAASLAAKYLAELKEQA